MNRSITILALVLASVGLSFASDNYVRTYDGPPLPRERVAFLAIIYDLTVTTLDNRKISHNDPLVLELLPGKHELECLANSDAIRSYGVLPHLSFIAEAGHTYLLGWTTEPGSVAFFPHHTEFRWQPIVDDITEPVDTPCAGKGREHRSCVYRQKLLTRTRKEAFRQIDRGFAEERVAYDQSLMSGRR